MLLTNFWCTIYYVCFIIVSSEVTFIHNVTSEHQTLQQYSTPIDQHLNLETSCNGVNNVSSIKVDDPQSLCTSGKTTSF